LAVVVVELLATGRSGTWGVTTYVKLRITGLLPTVVPVPDMLPDDDDPLEEPEAPLLLLLLLPELPLELLLEPLLVEDDPLPPEAPLELLLEADPDFELPVFDLLLLLLFVVVVV
jgi:hypothetical protein